MNNFLRILCASFTLATAPMRGCIPTTTHVTRYASQNVPQDVFISEKLKRCSPDKRAQISNALRENLREDHASDANPKTTINATLRGFSCP